ncbi:MAG: enoyl-CoA hydratase/isomerase family protein, partial [Ilumatobacteraceae bacterium]
MTVRVERNGDVATIVLARPDVMNALDDATVGALDAALGDVADARVLVMAGEGRAFSAGRDLSSATPLEEDARAILTDLFNPVILKLRNLPIPTIASVRGAALGVGFGVAMACDMILAGEKTRLGSPFANIGCVLDSGGHAALV